jgi:hypothetical protein
MWTMRELCLNKVPAKREIITWLRLTRFKIDSQIQTALILYLFIPIWPSRLVSACRMLARLLDWWWIQYLWIDYRTMRHFIHFTETFQKFPRGGKVSAHLCSNARLYIWSLKSCDVYFSRCPVQFLAFLGL